MLAVVPVLAGDYNGDGSVDAADYTVCRDALGATGAGLAADGNGDKAIDTGDYTIWRARFGQSNRSGASMHATVPKPATMAILLIAIVMLIHRHAVVS